MVISTTTASCCSGCCSKENEENQARVFMENLNFELNKRKNIEYNAAWDYDSNITADTAKHKNDVAAENAKYVNVSKNHYPHNFVN